MLLSLQGTFPPAILALADGTVLIGNSIGATGSTVGEVVFNTSITGYQEILTDPSYAGQIITFTFPHIGNVGTNLEDIESLTPAARGVVLRGDITEPANWRAVKPLDDWLKGHNLPGVCGVDTRGIENRNRIIGHLFEVVRSLGLLAAAGAAVVEGDRAPAQRERRTLEVPPVLLRT